jgi:hypothetical protein
MPAQIGPLTPGSGHVIGLTTDGYNQISFTVSNLGAGFYQPSGGPIQNERLHQNGETSERDTTETFYFSYGVVLFLLWDERRTLSDPC